MAFYGRENLFKELITVNIDADETKQITHRLFGAPNYVNVKHVSGWGDVSIVSQDVDKIVLYNSGPEEIQVEVELHRFKSDEADCGITDKTGASDVYSDGIDQYVRHKLNPLVAVQQMFKFEDPWLRYVDPVSGDNTSDGKTPGTAWQTINYAIRQKPVIGGTCIIKLLDGTFNESIALRGDLTGLVIAGSWETLYSQVTTTAGGYSNQDIVNTSEGLTRMTITDAGAELPVDWDDMISLWVEFEDNNNERHRMVIVETDKVNNRIFLMGKYPPATIIDQTIAITRPSSVISSSDYPGTVQVFGQYQTQTVQDQYPANFQRGVVLHGVRIAGAGGNSSLYVASEASLGIGHVMIDGASGSSVRTVKSTIRPCYFDVYSMQASVLQLIDSRVDYIDGTLDVSPNSSASSRFSHQTDVDGISFLSLNQFDVYIQGNGGRYRIYDFYVRVSGTRGVVYVSDDVIMSLSGRIVLGRSLVCSTYPNSPMKIQMDPTATVGFRGTPYQTYGRIFAESAVIHVNTMLDCNTGDIEGYTSPIIQLQHNSILKVYDAVIGSAGNEPNRDITVYWNSQFHVERNITVYCGRDASQPNTVSIYIDRNSIMTLQAGDMVVNAKMALTNLSDVGIITVERGSKLHVQDPSGSLTINQSVGVTTGCDLCVLDSIIEIEGDLVISSTFTGRSVIVDHGRLKVKAFAQDTDGQAMLVWGENATVECVGDYVVAGAKLACPVFSFTQGSRGTFGGKADVPVADYGVGSLWELDDAALVQWLGISPGVNPGQNFNTNAGPGAYGTSVKRSSVLIKDDAGGAASGPTGTTGDMSLGGIAGATAYPAAGVSINDIVNGAESAAQMAVCHGK